MSRLLEPPTDRQVFTRVFEPQPYEIDSLGHVNNVIYLAWAQDLAIAHWLARAPSEDQAKWAWVALRHEIDYRRALRLGERALGRTWVAKVADGPRFDRFVRIDGPDGAMCAQVRTVWCLIEAETGRPKRVSERLTALFEQPQAAPAD